MPLKIKAAIMAAAMFLTLIGWKSLNALFLTRPGSAVEDSLGDATMPRQAQKTETEWKETLGADRFAVMRECGTEPPFSGSYNLYFEKGVYLCAACGTPLFSSKSKYDHGTGWPGFSSAIDESRPELRGDRPRAYPGSEARGA